MMHASKPPSFSFTKLETMAKLSAEAIIALIGILIVLCPVVGFFAKRLLHRLRTGPHNRSRTLMTR
jgi:hypothetical protein